MQGLVRDDASRTTDLSGATSALHSVSEEGTVKTVSVICAINDAIAERIGQQKFNIWFKDTTRLTFKDGLLNVGVANQFIASWLESHFHAQVAEAAKSVVGGDCRLTFAVEPLPRQSNASMSNALMRNSSAHHSSRIYSSAHPPMSQPVPAQSHRLKLHFDAFVVGPSNQLAYDAAKAVVCDKQSPFNPLFIHGGCGLGKTHLLQGICNEMRTARPTATWLYLSAEDFANQFVLALKTRKLEAFRRRMRQTDLLAIDDIHFLASKPATQDEFLFTFNALDLAGSQVVLASDSHPKEIAQLSEKLVNRFLSGMVVKINAPDFKTRREIIRRYARTLNKLIPEEVIDYVADNMKRSIRELQGAILKLTASASLQNTAIDLAMAQAVLTNHIERCDPAVRLSDIESAAAAFFGITPSAIHSSKKDRTIALARHFSMYLARKHTRLSSSEIGRLLGGKNHATVLLACKKIDEKAAQNTPVNWQGPAGNKVSTIKAILEHLESNIR